MNKYIVAILLCITASAAQAQVSFTSLQDVWKYADEHSIQILTAEQNKNAAAINVKQAYGSLLPNASVSGGVTDNLKLQATLIPANLFDPSQPAGTFSEVTFGRPYNYSGAVTVQLDILNTQDWFNIKAAKLNNKLASLNIAKSKMDLYTQVANAYYSYILLCEAESLSRQNLTTTTTIYDLSNDKFKDGQISEITVNSALIDKEKAEKSLAVAVQNEKIQLNNLKSLLNIKDSIVLTEKLQNKNIESASSVFSEDPNVALAYTQMMLSQNQLKASKAVFAPTLTGVYEYGTQILGDNFLNFSNTNSTPMEYWGLRLSMPIFTGNSRRYQIQANKIDFINKQELYENTKLQADINNENALINYTASMAAFEKSKSIMELYKSNDEHAERKLEAGVLSLDDRLKAFSDLISGQNDYLQSMSDFFIQEYNLQIRQTNFIK